ncbi:PEP/pyruvate-binding domain-containing protein [Limnoglobus roseus]|uniref:Phosphoenolpyruvate--protein phosphotransferase n=1 Tax=Limnoglobus roseus TaxID=2598579 RepID=A0A5C1ALH6_9BACT|nr:PEP/pyruvate-binding domain-containing protein [Limnoglobus roseus]QEL18044.1 phosphoenolpyruvate--protein phosphotransferase [Limnoglobus roseus]
MAEILSFEAVTAEDAPRIGGKGASLAEMAKAGLPVPTGFVITTDVYRRLWNSGLRSEPALANLLIDCFQKLGGGVAVRSSATDEDGSAASFAGQQETILGVHTGEELLAAVERCWNSLHSDRAKAYRQKQGIADDKVAMAVVVQKLIPAESAGVLFTHDPTTPNSDQMIVEASFGLGEAVVSGKVTPDRFALDRRTGKVIERTLGRKTIRVVDGREEPVPPELQKTFCISDAALAQLAELGRAVEAHYGDPRDIEWAVAGGQIFLLQARPITTRAEDGGDVRAEVIDRMKSLADPRGTVWVRYNLSEILPRPTPMTWAVVQHFMAADGGVGRMNCDFGGNPDPALNGVGAFDLVAGRPMANLSRMPRLQFSPSPFEYPLAQFRADPRLALDPKPSVNPLKDGVFKGLFRLPGLMRRLSRMAATVREQSESFAGEFRTVIVPPFAADAKAAMRQKWSQLDSSAVLGLFQQWVPRTLTDFARHSLKPTFLAENAWNGLIELLKPKLGDERARTAVGELALGAKPDPGTDLPAAFYDLAVGRIDRAEFLERFGHRTANEMELAAPRWSETPGALPVMPSRATPPKTDPLETILEEAKLSAATAEQLRKQAGQLRTYLGLRESAKHYLLLGYAVIRRALVELDGRYKLDGGIFDLLPDELPGLLQGRDVRPVIAARRKRRQRELALAVPHVLFSDDLDAIGRLSPPPEGAKVLSGTALSFGVAEGPALVLREPTSSEEAADGFVLVCPSTDPAWVPLFARATALVMETGGLLSHGAIVAREFGLPAVAGLPDATRQLQTGQRVRVDGNAGVVTVLD